VTSEVTGVVVRLGHKGCHAGNDTRAPALNQPMRLLLLQAFSDLPLAWPPPTIQSGNQ